MTANREIYLALTQLGSAIKELDMGDAVKYVDDVIATCQKDYLFPAYIVRKAALFWSAGERAKSVDLLKECCRDYENDVAASYFLGEHLIEMGDFRVKSQFCCKFSSTVQAEFL
jgi:hypothetical protein